MWRRRPRASSIPAVVDALGSCDSALAVIHRIGTSRTVAGSTSPGRSWKSGTGGSRRNSSCGSSGGSSTANASGVTAPGSTPTNRVSTPKSSSSCTATSPNGSAPTLVNTAARCPRRAAAIATLVGLPPTALLKLRAACQSGADLIAVQVDADPPDREQLQIDRHLLRRGPWPRRPAPWRPRLISGSARALELVAQLLELGAARHQRGQLRRARSPTWRRSRASARA